METSIELPHLLTFPPGTGCLFRVHRCSWEGAHRGEQLDITGEPGTVSNPGIHRIFDDFRMWSLLNLVSLACTQYMVLGFFWVLNTYELGCTQWINQREPNFVPHPGPRRSRPRIAAARTSCARTTRPLRRWKSTTASPARTLNCGGVVPGTLGCLGYVGMVGVKGICWRICWFLESADAACLTMVFSRNGNL